MRSPQNVKEVQQLIGRVMALSRFISRASKTAMPIVNTLKKEKNFTWTLKCEEAFLRLKALLATPPILGAERRYQRIEKAALALVTASRWLRPYFQNFSIVVHIDLPIRQVLRKQDLAGRMVAWSIQLSEFDIAFEKRLAMLEHKRLSNQAGSGAGVILEGPDRIHIEQSLHFEFKETNNQAEYEVLLASMRLAFEVEVKRLTAKSDSKLVTGQVNGEYQTKDLKLVKYWEKATTMVASFEKFTLLHVPRDQNERADLLTKLASTQKRGLQRLIIHESLSALMVDRFEVQNNEALAGKIARAGYYWLTLKVDCMDYVKKCDRCQRFVAAHQAPPGRLHIVTSPWPFHKWGIDILGPFPIAPSQVKFLIVAVDYFTKWVEAEPVATITTERVKRFIWKKIICQFGLPAEIVSDNGTQFASSTTTKFCQDLNIRQSFTFVEHPQANGQAEAANKVILSGLYKRLEEAKGRWAEELP
ncbi:Pro-Pol polyprotein, partial [Mucuna pruriens]